MTPEEQIDVVQTFVKYVAKLDWEGATTLMHDDFVMPEPSDVPYAGRWQGREGFLDLMQHFYDTWGRWRDAPYPYDLVSVGNLVFKEVKITADLKRTGRRVEMYFAEVFEFRDDKMISIRPYYFDPSVIGRLNDPDLADEDVAALTRAPHGA